MDSNGLFQKLWQFSSFMVSKGFKIIEVGNEDKFDDGDMPKAEYDNVHVIQPHYGGRQILHDKITNRSRLNAALRYRQTKPGRNFFSAFFMAKLF